MGTTQSAPSRRKAAHRRIIFSAAVWRVKLVSFHPLHHVARTNVSVRRLMESALKALTKVKKSEQTKQSVLPSLPTSPRPPGMSEEKHAYWTRLATPRDGYSRDPASGPAKWTSEAVCARNAFLAAHGYLSAGPEERRQRRNGRVHRSSKAPTVHERADLTIEQQRAKLYFCYRATRPIPDRYLLAARPPPDELL